MKLQEFNFVPEYIKGENNAADGLSRYSSICKTELVNQKIPINDPNTQLKTLQEYHITSKHGSKNNMKHLLKDKFSWDNMFP
jgi:hypothetical protein